MSTDVMDSDDPRQWMERRDVIVSVWQGTMTMSGELVAVNTTRNMLTLGELGVTRNHGTSPVPWRIVHLPSGGSFGALGCCFVDEISAARAVTDMCRERNTWNLSGLRPDEIASAVKTLKVIATRHGGVAEAGPAVALDPDMNLNRRDNEI